MAKGLRLALRFDIVTAFFETDVAEPFVCLFITHWAHTFTGHTRIISARIVYLFWDMDASGGKWR